MINHEIFGYLQLPWQCKSQTKIRDLMFACIEVIEVLRHSCQTITWDKQKWFTRISPAEKHLPGWGVPWLFLAGYVAFLQHYEELYWGHLIYYTDLYCNTMVAPPMSHDRDSSIIESSHELALQCMITVSCRYYSDIIYNYNYIIPNKKAREWFNKNAKGMIWIGDSNIVGDYRGYLRRTLRYEELLKHPTVGCLHQEIDVRLKHEITSFVVIKHLLYIQYIYITI